jgi:hypothetical protein
MYSDALQGKPFMTRKVRVDKGIPMPRPTRKYQWDTMEVGESFRVAKPPDQPKEIFVRQMRVQATRAGKKYGRVFATRTSPNGMRIWRMA